jgi:hypothetical protein
LWFLLFFSSSAKSKGGTEEERWVGHPARRQSRFWGLIIIEKEIAHRKAEHKIIRDRQPKMNFF